VDWLALPESDEEPLDEGCAVGPCDTDCDEERDVERLLDSTDERDELTLDDVELSVDTLDDPLAEPLSDEEGCVERELDALCEKDGAPEADALELCKVEGTREALPEKLAEEDGRVD
jgi:hypothetical protein